MHHSGKGKWPSIQLLLHMGPSGIVFTKLGFTLHKMQCLNLCTIKPLGKNVTKNISNHQNWLSKSYKCVYLFKKLSLLISIVVCVAIHQCLFILFSWFLLFVRSKGGASCGQPIHHLCLKESSQELFDFTFWGFLLPQTIDKPCEDFGCTHPIDGLFWNLPI
jgi:hypothetical protein